MTSISSYGIQLSSAQSLSSGLARLNMLNEQLSTGKKSLNLIDYTASDALNLLDFTNAISRRTSYLQVINTVSPRIEAYDSSLTGIENSLATVTSSMLSATTYSTTNNETLASSFQSALEDMTYYLNQTVSGRYIFAGSRFQTMPVTDLTTLPTVETFGTASSTVQTNCLTVKATESGTFGNDITINLSAGTTAGTTKVTIGKPGQANEVFDNIEGADNTLWQNIATTINNGQEGPPAVAASRLLTATSGTGTTAPNYTTTTLSGGTGEVINGAASTQIGTNGMTFCALNQGTYGNDISVAIEDGTNANTRRVIITAAGYPTETYDNIDDSAGGAAFWSNVSNALNKGQAGPPAVAASQLVMATAGASTVLPASGVTTNYALSGGTARVETTDYVTDLNEIPSYDTQFDSVGGVPDPNKERTDAYYQDQVAIDNSKVLGYGISSNQSGFQKAIMGLRYAYAATQDPDNYESLMNTAQTLIAEGQNEIRGYHSALSSDQATLQTMKERQNTLISNLGEQIGDIQSVDTNEIAVKLTSFQAALEASYSATARIVNLSILNYL